MKIFYRRYIPQTSTRLIAFEALLLGLYIILSLITINISESLRISFSFLALALSCYYFGFWPNVIFAFAADFFGYILNPTGAYMPLFVLVAILNAAIYSFFFFFKEEIGWKRVILAKSIQVILSNLILNPLILLLLYETPFISLFVPRLIKNIIQLPIDIVLLYFALRLGREILKRQKWLLQIKNKALE